MESPCGFVAVSTSKTRDGERLTLRDYGQAAQEARFAVVIGTDGKEALRTSDKEEAIAFFSSRL